MAHQQKIFILIPAFNEATAVKSVIRACKAEGFPNILIVDDGSSDGTGEAAREEGGTVVQHAINRGKGAAVKTGFEACKLLQADIVVTLDADGQHDASDIKNMLKPIQEGYDITLGQRTFKLGVMPLAKIAANHIANIFTFLLSGLSIHDSQCGFRAYSRTALKKLETTADNFALESEIIRSIREQNLRFAEVPIRTIYTSYSTKKKNAQNFWNGLKTLYGLISK